MKKVNMLCAFVFMLIGITVSVGSAAFREFKYDEMKKELSYISSLRRDFYEVKIFMERIFFVDHISYKAYIPSAAEIHFDNLRKIIEAESSVPAGAESYYLSLKNVALSLLNSGIEKKLYDGKITEAAQMYRSQLINDVSSAEAADIVYERKFTDRLDSISNHSVFLTVSLPLLFSFLISCVFLLKGRKNLILLPAALQQDKEDSAATFTESSESSESAADLSGSSAGKGLSVSSSELISLLRQSSDKEESSEEVTANRSALSEQIALLPSQLSASDMGFIREYSQTAAESFIRRDLLSGLKSLALLADFISSSYMQLLSLSDDDKNFADSLTFGILSAENHEAFAEILSSCSADEKSYTLLHNTFIRACNVFASAAEILSRQGEDPFMLLSKEGRSKAAEIILKTL